MTSINQKLKEVERKIEENDRAMINCKIYHNNHKELLEEHKRLRNLKIQLLKWHQQQIKNS